MADWTSLLDGLNAAALGAFGREVTYLPGSGAPGVIRAVYQPAHDAEEATPGVYAVLFIRLADVPLAPQLGDRVQIGNLIYTVYGIEADGSGAAVLRIRQV